MRCSDLHDKQSLSERKYNQRVYYNSLGFKFASAINASTGPRKQIPTNKRVREKCSSNNEEQNKPKRPEFLTLSAA